MSAAAVVDEAALETAVLVRYTEVATRPDREYHFDAIMPESIARDPRLWAS